MIEPLGLSEGSKAFITMRKCKSLARVIKARRVPAWPTAPTPDLPPKELADALVERYLSTLETVFRVLHVPTFKRDYAAVWAPDAKPDPAFLVQLKLVLAIGAASHDRVFSLRIPAVRWVYEGHTWLSTPEFKRRLTVQSLQTNILLIFAREFVGVDEGSLWISVGSLFRAATYMGLHRDPVYLPKRSLFASEMRRRLWNTILELAVWTSLGSGGSPFLSLDDFDARAPGNYDDDQLTLEDATPRPADHFTQSSVAIALRETFPARLAVLKFLNELGSAGEYDEALRLDANLRAAYKTMGHSLRTQNTDPGSSEPPRFALRVADVLMNRYFASLHVPFFSPLFNQMSFAFSRKVVGDACLRISQALMPPKPISQAASGPAGDEAVPYDMDDSLTRLVMCASGPFRIAATYSSLMIAAELKLQRREDDSVSSAPPRPDLLAVVQNSLIWTKQGIKAGETNVKGLIFATMVSTELQCIIEGISRDDIALRLIRSVEEVQALCQSLLEDLAAAGQPEGMADASPGQLMLATPPDLMEMEDWDFSVGSRAHAIARRIRLPRDSGPLRFCSNSLLTMPPSQFLDTQFNGLGSMEPMSWMFGDSAPQWQ